MKPHKAFHAWLISLGVMPSTFTHVVVNDRIPELPSISQYVSVGHCGLNVGVANYLATVKHF